MEDLLIYTVIADRNDEIKLSFLYNPKKDIYTMPSLTIERYGKQMFYADNDIWLTQNLFWAIEGFLEKRMGLCDKEAIGDMLLYMTEQNMKDLHDILKYAIDKGMFYQNSK
jgi:hypothetical protein